MTTLDELLTTRQAAALLGVTQGRVQQLVAEGRLPARKVGRDNLVRRADLALVTDRRRTGRPKR